MHKIRRPRYGWEIFESPSEPITMVAAATKKMQEEEYQVVLKVEMGTNEKRDKQANGLQYKHHLNTLTWPTLVLLHI
jgi:hypothetical protein